jgi:hypothetical protein
VGRVGGFFDEAAIAAIPVHSRTPAVEPDTHFPLPHPSRTRNPLHSHKLASTTLWLSICTSLHGAHIVEKSRRTEEIAKPAESFARMEDRYAIPS